jgi:hypothetical protein
MNMIMNYVEAIKEGTEEDNTFNFFWLTEQYLSGLFVGLCFRDNKSRTARIQYTSGADST